MTFLRLLCFLFLCSCGSTANQKSSDVFGGVDMDAVKITKLEKDFLDEGQDGVNDAFFELSDQMRKALLKNKGVKLSLQDKRKLITLVQRAQHITAKYDPANMHYFGFSKLYQKIPDDLTRAVNNSNLSFQNKKEMLTRLKNNVGPSK